MLGKKIEMPKKEGIKIWVVRKILEAICVTIMANNPKLTWMHVRASARTNRTAQYCRKSRTAARGTWKKVGLRLPMIVRTL